MPAAQRSRLPRRGSVALALAFTAALVAGIRVETRRDFAIFNEGVLVRRLPPGDVPAGTKIDARMDDYELASDSIRVVVGASRGRDRAVAHAGALLDVTASTWEADALSYLQPVAALSGRPLPPSSVDVHATNLRQRPAVLIRSRPTDDLSLVTLLSVDPGSNRVLITSRLTNTSNHALEDVGIADRLSWPGLPTFVPGEGEIERSMTTKLVWLGRRDPDQSYALVYPKGPVETRFIVEPFESTQTIFGPSHSLAPGEALVLDRVLIASFRSMTDAATAAWQVSGVPTGRLVGQLDPAPPRAELTAIAADKTVEMITDSDAEGRFELPVRPGLYTITLHTSGGTSDALVEARAGQTERVELDVPTPGLLRFRITDAADTPMPARLVFHGAGATPDPDLGPDYRAAAGGNEVHSATGVGSVKLPPGRYAVTISRGPEYSVVTQRVGVDAGTGAVLPVILVREMETPGWIAADFHVHAAPSMDSEVTLADRVVSLLAAGVEVAVATDHNEITDYGPEVLALGAGKEMAAIPGVEVTTEEWGHFNAYPLDPLRMRPPPYSSLEPRVIFEGLRDDAPGAIVQINHPWMGGYGYFDRARLDHATGNFDRVGASHDFDAVEVINGFELEDPEALDKNLERWFQLLNRGWRYTAVGNSDSHRVSRQWAGWPRTYVGVLDTPPEEIDGGEIADALRAGRTVVSNGPFIEASVEGVGPGGTVKIPPGPARLSVTVRAADWVDVSRAQVYVDGELTDVLPADTPSDDGPRIARTVDLDVEQDAWIVVVARGDRPLSAVLPGIDSRPFAFTNAIFVDVDEAAPPRARARDAATPLALPGPDGAAATGGADASGR